MRHRRERGASCADALVSTSQGDVVSRLRKFGADSCAEANARAYSSADANACAHANASTDPGTARLRRAWS